MSGEKGTDCTVHGCTAVGRYSSVHTKGSGSYDHDWQRAPRKKNRPVVMGRSDVGQAEAEQWQEDKADHLLEHPECELAGFLAGKCDELLDVHHVTPRSMGGTRHDDSELVTACRKHHDLIERNRDFARIHGLLKRRHLPPELRSLVEIPDPAFPVREVAP